MENPLVTVNILSFNRKDELRITLTKVFEQDYKNIEVIVVDNASSDGTQQMVKKEFPSVNLIELPDNIGIAGWNKGFEIAKGEFVLVLDDDSYPDDGIISQAIYKILSKKDIAVIAFNVINMTNNQSQTMNYLSENTLEFVGCGAIIQKSIFDIVGGFDENIFIYAHERDFSIRVLNLGYKILYLPHLRVFHMPLLKNRSHPLYNRTRIFYGTVSFVVILKKYLKKNHMFKYYKLIIKLIVNRILMLLYFNEIKLLYSIFKEIIILDKNRKILNLNVSDNILAKYNYFNIPLFDEQFFPRKDNNSKVVILFLYISSVFQSKKKKISRIQY